MKQLNNIRGWKRFIPLLFTICVFAGCKKDFLDTKSSQSLVVPSTLSDYQDILNNSGLFSGFYPLGELGAGDLYETSNSWNAGFSPTSKNAYIWAIDVYASYGTSDNWNNDYQQVFYADIASDGLKIISKTSQNTAQWNSEMGTALFYRGSAFFDLSQLYCKPYDSTTAVSDLGIPLRLVADVKAKSVRSSVAQTYAQIINDLLQSSVLLGTMAYQHSSINPYYLPTQTAAFAMLAKTYLVMGKYNDALKYASLALSQQSNLIDFNTISQASGGIYPYTDNEDILWRESGAFEFLYPNYDLLVDSSLYQQFSNNDLRKSVYFAPYEGYYTFLGEEAQADGIIFTGIKTDEMYLIKAECEARLGSTSAAMSDLNTLLVTRWKTGTFIQYTAVGADDALAQILTERRKELCFRNTRWSDLRRLNKDPRFAITLTHVINNTTYTLPPNDPRYVMPIGIDEIRADGIQQNPR